VVSNYWSIPLACSSFSFSWVKSSEEFSPKSPAICSLLGGFWCQSKRSCIWFFIRRFRNFFFFFFDNPGCPDQLTCTSINLWTHWTPYKPSGQVKHRRDDKHAQKGSNPDTEKENKTFPPLNHKLKCNFLKRNKILCFVFS
jgi:hypothetical protein